MAAEFAVYHCLFGPDIAPRIIGVIYAEGARLPVIFTGKSETKIIEEMSEFWDREVRKMHGSAAVRERRMKAMAEARKARAAHRASKEGNTKCPA